MGRESVKKWLNVVDHVRGVNEALNFLESDRPHSSKSIVRLGGYGAKLSKGQTLVLTEVTRTGRDWVITFDGNSKLHFVPSDTNGVRESHLMLRVIDHAVAAPKGSGKLRITLCADFTVEVRWPWTWSFRE